MTLLNAKVPSEARKAFKIKAIEFQTIMVRIPRAIVCVPVRPELSLVLMDRRDEAVVDVVAESLTSFQTRILHSPSPDSPVAITEPMGKEHVCKHLKSAANCFDRKCTVTY